MSAGTLVAKSIFTMDNLWITDGNTIHKQHTSTALFIHGVYEHVDIDSEHYCILSAFSDNPHRFIIAKAVTHLEDRFHCILDRGTPS